MKKSASYRVFNLFNVAFLSLLALVCILPLVHVLALSFSSNSSAAAGLVKLWPVGFTTSAYEFILRKPEFMQSMLVTLQRVGLGTTVNLLLTLLVAYPLSKETAAFRFRTPYAWIFVFTILFNGGLIPWYMTIKWTGIMDTLWALVLPGAVPVFNVILLLNFFRGLPKELDESASIDGAGHWTTMWRIYVPMSMPAIATITLFTIVGHWNSWFDGLILMKVPEHFPLSTYLQTIIVNIDLTSMSGKDFEILRDVSDRTAKASQIFLGALPIILVYPFLQRYFVKGIVLGSVKG
ncbi:carbohydrate ABC transporter permease [Paenibacillus sp. PAMC21692]|uniref:carbohydrate ABC transporter permease n=1 Tax=Paenibacillus sp. PAMC21692 TaxID=2762320 RepID=UPI00164E1EAE|nr:carbohydrate ABC transporter permease [Paenibacillus sp. PAMC21692]QNK58877.1 carbohydrate ABC transporter permease [Paenibacillus sp. PAMC21692]